MVEIQQFSHATHRTDPIDTKETALKLQLDEG